MSCIIIDQGTQLSNCILPYGPLWYLANIGYVIGSWLIWIMELSGFVALTFWITRKHIGIRMAGFAFISYLIISAQPYLISSVLWLMLGIINPLFGLVALLDRLPLLTSWSFTSSGSWLEPTHIIRYGIFGLWYIGNIVYWVRGIYKK